MTGRNYEFFVRHDGDMSPDFVRKLLKALGTSSDPVQYIVNMLHEFRDTGSKDDLSYFQLVTTGSMIATGGLRPECIEVSIEQIQGFFASTYSFELEIPASIPNSAEFKLAFKSIIKGNRFTTV